MKSFTATHRRSPSAPAKAVGVRSAWILLTQLFAWRKIKSRKQLGALVGTGDRHVHALIVELAWLWLRWQPASALTQWYEGRFASGNKRLR